MPFSFDLDEDRLTLESAVYQALGAASMCWDTLSNAGVFHSEEAKEIGEVLVDWIKGEEKGQTRAGHDRRAFGRDPMLH